MISKPKNKSEAYVWIFLPKAINPIVAGRVTKDNDVYYFTYGKSYLENVNSIPLSPFELPLERQNFYPEGMNTIHSCLRDAGPDAWGRRLIEYQYQNFQSNELDYLLLSGSNRVGALDFQESNIIYQNREIENVSIEELLQVAEWVQAEKKIPKELEYALIRGTSIGGATPKALIQDKKKQYIAKFGLTKDTFNPIKAEFIGMVLAKRVGIEVPEVKLCKVLGKDVLMVERFDRIYAKEGIQRKLMLSALSLLKLNEMEARYASYIDLAEIIRQRFNNPKLQLIELYKRLIFNILIGNTDDHAKNHSTFWDGKNLSLTPAYDLCPQVRTGQEATQGMSIGGSEGNLSKLTNVLSICDYFQINKVTGKEIIQKMITIIEENWKEVAEVAELSEIDHEKLWRKSVFNPFCFQDWNL